MHYYANGFDYKFIQEKDGWWSIYRYHEYRGEYIPLLQANNTLQITISRYQADRDSGKDCKDLVFGDCGLIGNSQLSKTQHNAQHDDASEEISQYSRRSRLLKNIARSEEITAAYDTSQRNHLQVAVLQPSVHFLSVHGLSNTTFHIRLYILFENTDL